MIGNIELDSEKLVNVMNVSTIIDNSHTVVLMLYLSSSGLITSMEWLLSPPSSSGSIRQCLACTMPSSDKPSLNPGSTSLQVMTYRMTCSRCVILDIWHIPWCLELTDVAYQAFLSKEMMYSCALWSDKEGGIQGDLLPRSGDHSADLEMAQQRKIHHVLRKARVKRGQRILEIGSGWGGLAIEVCQDYLCSLGRNTNSSSFHADQAARTYGCEVDTLTLSIEQKQLAEERIHEAGLQHLIRVHLLDYREIPPDFEKKFDAFISIEMVEVHSNGRLRKPIINLTPCSTSVQRWGDNYSPEKVWTDN
jgi:Mycolic acid cyclopropane synthetase